MPGAGGSTVLPCGWSAVDRVPMRCPSGFPWKATASLNVMDQPQQAVPPEWTSGLVLVTRANCHLCTDARAVVGRVAVERGVQWRDIDIEEDPELLERFSEEVPVLLLDGVQRDFWSIDEERLRRLLA